jgi:hypothetical protein
MPNNPTLTLVCYPHHVWRPSVAANPPGRNYNWREHFRSIVALAREVHLRQPIELKCAGSSEIWFIAKLAGMTESEREEFIREMADDPRDDMMRWLNPDVMAPSPSRRPVAAAARRSR